MYNGLPILTATSEQTVNNIELTIKIDIKPTEFSSTDTAGKKEDGSFRMVLDGKSSLDIDTLEDGLLRTGYSALREALAKHLSSESKKKAIEEKHRLGEGYQVVRHKSDYRVDGEIGRFEFGLFNVEADDQKKVFEGTSLFPARKGKQWYQTCGFKEIALLNGVAQRSYRQTMAGFNRCRRQLENGTPLNTLRDSAEVEGSKVINFLEKKSEGILKENEFSTDGVPETNSKILKTVENNSPTPLEKNRVKEALVPVCKNMRQKLGMSEKLIKEVNEKASEKVYEKLSETVHIHLDDVGVKKQKEHRRSNEPSRKKNDKKRPKVQNTVARLEHNSKGFTLTGNSLFQVLLFVLGFRRYNKLISKQILFVTDGQRSLQDTIVSFFSWHPSISLLLDWYHLVKKFREELSLASVGRTIRNQHLRQLLRFLWFGLIDQASNYLREIPASDLKNAEAINRLLGYLERNYKWLPCYALRSQLKLPNSSNPVERTNNLVTSRRQKHNGMSWSSAGSRALTALNVVVLNGGVQPWVKNQVIPFEFVEKAA